MYQVWEYVVLMPRVKVQVHFIDYYKSLYVLGRCERHVASFTQVKVPEYGQKQRQ